MRSIGAWRVTLRIARRTATRHPGRSTLIFLMLALPVFACTVASVAEHTTAVSAQTRATWTMGAADAVLTARDAADLPGIRAALPSDVRAVRYDEGTVGVRTAAGVESATSVATDLDDPLLAGRYLLRAGRIPTSGGSVALSSTLAHQLGLGVGDVVEVQSADAAETHAERIVGLVDDPSALDSRLVFGVTPEPAATASLWITLPDGANPENLLFPRLEGFDLSLYVRSDRLQAHQDSWLDRYGQLLVIVGFAATEVILLAGSAFAVGARRQRRELAVIGATGADAADVRRIVLGGGILLGAASGIVGVAAGVGAVAVGRPLLQDVANHVLRPTVLRPSELIGIAVLAVLAGLVAAVLPAHWAGQQPVLDSLTGRTRIPSGSQRRVVLTGLGVAAAGALLVLRGAATPARLDLIAAGSAVGLVGFALWAPALVSAVGRLAPRMPTAIRLALREAARHRNRTGATVAAVTAAVAGSMALSLYLASSADRTAREPLMLPVGASAITGTPEELSSLTPATVNAVAATLAADRVTQLSTARQIYLAGDCPCSSVIAVGGDDIAEAITGRHLTADQAALLDRGGIVVFDRAFIDHGVTTVMASPGASVVPDGATAATNPPSEDASGALAGPPPAAAPDTQPQETQPPAADPTTQLPASYLPEDNRYYQLPSALISPATAQRLHAGAVLDKLLFQSADRPTHAQVQRANAQLAKDTNQTWFLTVGEPHPNESSVSLLVLAAVSATVTLAATAVAIGLAAAEAREDTAILGAVGAAPRVRRTLASARAGVIAVLGTALGIPAGVIPAAGVIATHRDSLRFVVPWGPLALGCLVAPVLVVIIAWVTTRSRLPMPRRLT
jgi:putative ABC transport system permease protein